MWWLVTVGCNQPDPVLVAQKEAAALADEGEAKLAAGDAAGARERFAAARATHDAPLLAAWEATAMARAGDLEGATQLAAKALERAPTLAAARYNRAAWLVGLGRPDEAGPELQRALADGAAVPLEVLDDPDFASVLDHGAFSFLPKTALVAATEVVRGAAFLGGEVELRLVVDGLVPDLRVEAATLRGPIELVRATEEREGPHRVSVTWVHRVVGAGEVVLGPFTVTSGARSAIVEPITLTAEAPPDHRAPAVTPWLPVPSQHTRDRPAWVHEGRWFVRAGPFDKVRFPTPSVRPARLETSLEGALQSVLHVVQAPPAGGEIVVEEADGTEKWRGTPQPG